MIRGTRLSLRRGTKRLLEDANFVVHPGDRIGVVGKNGAGKTSLFALLQGQLDAEAGTLAIPPDWRISSVAQEITSTAMPAREFVIDGDRQLRALQAERDRTPPENGARIAELELALTDADAWTAASRAERLLAGLGFRPDQWMQPVDNFSGGWRMRIALASALMAPSELLLLDEPTNHLDLDAMLWLEGWLASYPGAVMVISHDVEFLDAVARSILHFEDGSLQRYKGGYQDFLSQRSERLRQSRQNWERQTREAARLQEFVDRFKAKATKARQAQSRIKALARMQITAPLRAQAGIELQLPAPASMPDPLLILDQVATGYGEGGEAITVLRNVQLMVRSGSRIGVLGVNGAGKSTLIKTLAGILPPLSGTRSASPGLEVGYFAQHQLDMLDPEASPLQHLQRMAPDSREQELRNTLGRFGFSGDMATSPVAPLSGGEKARLALCLLVWRRPNLLLLDEPSNHLDVDTREALAAALSEYGGSMLLVSHDRHLLRTTVDDFWIVADGGVQEFDGDLEDYAQWLNQRSAAQRAEARADAKPGDQETAEARRERRRREAQARQRLADLRKPLDARVRSLDVRMESISGNLAELDARIVDPEFYGEEFRDERVQVLTQRGELARELETLEEQWLACQEEIETLEADARSRESG